MATNMALMRREMYSATRELLGPGYVRDYYEDMAADFIAIAENYLHEAEQATIAKVAEAERRVRREMRHTPKPVRFRFTGRWDGHYHWESINSHPGDSRVEHISVRVGWFWRPTKEARA
jgi:uncharacterized protein (DUF2249 family)